MSDNVLTIKEAANFLKVHWQTVRNYINSGKLKAYKVGRNIRIRQKELDRFIENKKPDDNKHEIEIRFATKKRKNVEEKLLDMNAKIVYHGHIIDHWFLPKAIKSIKDKNSFYESERGYSIRVREQDNGYTGKITTTLEVKKLAYPPSHEICLEEEIDILDFESVKNFLNLIEQREFAAVDKERLVYKLNEYKIIIDDIKNFTTGIEIELITDKDHNTVIPNMKKLAKKLGLDVNNELAEKSVTHQYMSKFSRF